MVSYIVDYLLDNGVDKMTAIGFACGVVAVSLVFCFLNMGLFYLSTILGLKLRVVFTGIINEKVK